MKACQIRRGAKFDRKHIAATGVQDKAIRKIGTHCVHVSTAMLTKCVGEGMEKLIRNNQVQVAEVLPLYAKGTGQQGV